MKLRNIATKYGPKVGTFALTALTAGLALAAEGDIEAPATAAYIAGIAAATLAVLAVIAALTGFQASKWVALQIKKLFGR